MKLKKPLFISFAVLWFGVMLLSEFGSQFKNHPTRSYQLEAAYTQSLREMVDQTCGACHINMHVETAGGYSLADGASTHAGGVIAQARGIDPTAMENSEPTTALIIQKPLEGSSIPHGGIKIPMSHPTMQALMAWVQSNAPSALMDRPAPAALAYQGGGANHEIVYARRQLRPDGFNSLRSAGQNGNIYRMSFSYNSGSNTNTISTKENITDLPASDDAQTPTVSLDGTKVAFARKQPGQNWQIWEVNSDGSGGLRQITRGNGNKLYPFYLPYLPDGTPARAGEGGIGFLSDAADFRDEYDSGLTLSLYVSDKDGGNVRQIDFNPSHDLHPWPHSSGLLLFTRWEHNEHQGHNFMPIFSICMSDYETAGTNLFGAYGEHNTSPAGNSLHEPSEVWTPGLETMMMARGSDRDDAGGSIVGFFRPKLEGDTGTAPDTDVIAQGDNDGREMEMDVVVTSVTYRSPRSLLNSLYTVSMATLTSTTLVFNEVNGSTEVDRVYSHFALYTFETTGNPPQMTDRVLLDQEDGFSLYDVVPVLVKPTPPKIGKPVDKTKNTGTFTSGDVRERQNDGQPRNFGIDQVSSVRFVRSLQLSQGRVETGRRRDRGISTQIVGEAPIASDGSFSAEVPAEVPMQFMLMDKQGRAMVKHKPWVQVMRGETMRCVGCHANHSAPVKIQTLEARQSPSQQIDTRLVKQFHFNKDIQPILTAKCAICHDSARKEGAAGRNRSISLVGRFTPANRTEAFETLIGDMSGMSALVRTQNSNASPLMWWLTGKKLDDSSLPNYPDPADKVDHYKMLTPEEITKIQEWIDTGVNFRVVADNVPSRLSDLSTENFVADVWPFLEQNCMACHSTGQAGGMAMDLDGDPEDAESIEDVIENRMEAVAARANYMVPEASTILRKPLPQMLGGLSHTGGVFYADTNDLNYMTILNWIKAANPSLSTGTVVSDLVNVSNYPNPFRDKTNIVYGLTGIVTASVDVRIYSQTGKMIRELSGTANADTAIGWNKVEWDGKDSNGKVVGNDIYFYTVDVLFGDGTKKRFRGKCVKVN